MIEQSKQILAKLGLWTWAVGGIAIGATLMVSHWVPLPHPEGSDAVLQTALSGHASDSNSWTVTHFLYADCPCSLRVLNHVIERTPSDSVRERFVLIDSNGDASDQAELAGLDVERLTSKQLYQTYGIEAAPLFAVTEPSGETVYVGGYTQRKQGLDISDMDIVRRLQEGESVDQLPVYGCAVSSRLKDIVDPLGLKD